MKNPLEELHLTVEERPRGDRIIVLPLLQATASAVGLVSMAENREKPERGIVLAVGPGGISPETGRPVPVLSQVGELVSHGKYAGIDFQVQGPDGNALRVIIMRDCEVLLYQDPGSYDLEIHDGDPRKVHLKGLVCEHCPPADLSALREDLRADGLLPPTTASDPDALIAQERARLAVTE